MFQFRNCVKFPFSINLSLDIGNFSLGGFEIVFDLLEDFFDCLFVSLGIVPFDHGFIELVFHLGDGALVIAHDYLVEAALHHIAALTHRATGQSCKVLRRHLLQFRQIELLGWFQGRRLV